MAANKTLELSIKIAGSVDKSLISAISNAQSSISSFSQTIGKIGTVGLAAMGALATGTAAAVINCTNEAEAFETQMGDVVKYVDGLADASGKISDTAWGADDQGNIVTYADNYEKMKDALLDLSTQIPMTAEDLTRLAASAGQSGKGISELVQYDGSGNITGFLRDAAMMGTAMDISADQAGDWAAKWEKAFNMDHSEIMVLADQINYLGAHSATTAAEIAQAVNDAASLGQIGGVDVKTTAALADAMLATGVDSGKVATSVKRTITNISKGSSATKAMKQQWEELGFTAEGVAKSMQEDSVGTLKSIFTSINNLPKEKQVAALSTLFGQWAIEGDAKIVGNMQVFEDALDMVNDPSLYSGSMEREFTIKASTSESIGMMKDNALKALKIEVGDSFLPVKKEFNTMLLSVIESLRGYMPQISQIAGNMASALSVGVEKASDVLEKAQPYIQQFLEYIANNGDKVVSVLGKLTAAFAAMKFAPAAEGMLKGAGNLLLGSAAVPGAPGAAGRRTGGIMGLFRGGQNLVAGAGSALGAAGGLISTAIIDARMNGPGNMLGALLGGTKIGNYIGGAGASLGNFLNVSGISGMASNVVNAGGQILSGIGQATGLTNLVNGGVNLARTGAGKVVGGVTTLASNVVNSAPVQAVSGFAGRVAGSAPVQGIANAAAGAAGWLGNTMSAGAGLLGSAWGPMASGFGSLLAGAAPVVAAISGVIAVVSILGDHLEDIRGIVGNVFGDAGVAVFDQFTGKLGEIGNFIQGLFRDGGVANALLPLRQSITEMFGVDAGAAFGGVTQILQSIMGVVGQVVNFATTTVKPIIQDIFSFLTGTVVPIILQTFTAAAPVISGIISNLGTAVMAGMQLIGSAIQIVMPVIQGVITAVLSIASVVIPALLAGYEAFSSGLANIVTAVQGVFQGILDFVTGVFTGNWSQAWEGVKQIFSSAFSALEALIKTPLNAVIALVNKAISGINSLSLDIPDWVPVVGGKNFSINIPEMPMLAKGGFTNGPSIAGEAGREAVISFDSGVRASNIATWERAGKMLGVSPVVSEMNNPPVELAAFEPQGSGGAAGLAGPAEAVTVTYSPTIIIQGNASREDVDAALRDDKARFRAWYEEIKRDERRVRY